MLAPDINWAARGVGCCSSNGHIGMLQGVHGTVLVLDRVAVIVSTA
jgi:hypothetical protein